MTGGRGSALLFFSAAVLVVPFSGVEEQPDSEEKAVPQRNLQMGAFLRLIVIPHIVSVIQTHAKRPFCIFTRTPLL